MKMNNKIEEIMNILYDVRHGYAEYKINFERDCVEIKVMMNNKWITCEVYRSELEIDNAKNIAIAIIKSCMKEVF